MLQKLVFDKELILVRNTPIVMFLCNDESILENKNSFITLLYNCYFETSFLNFMFSDSVLDGNRRK